MIGYGTWFTARWSVTPVLSEFCESITFWLPLIPWVVSCISCKTSPPTSPARLFCCKLLPTSVLTEPAEKPTIWLRSTSCRAFNTCCCVLLLCELVSTLLTTLLAKLSESDPSELLICWFCLIVCLSARVCAVECVPPGFLSVFTSSLTPIWNPAASCEPLIFWSWPMDWDPNWIWTEAPGPPEWEFRATFWSLWACIPSPGVESAESVTSWTWSLS